MDKIKYKEILKDIKSIGDNPKSVENDYICVLNEIKNSVGDDNKSLITLIDKGINKSKDYNTTLSILTNVLSSSEEKEIFTNIVSLNKQYDSAQKVVKDAQSVNYNAKLIKDLIKEREEVKLKLKSFKKPFRIFKYQYESYLLNVRAYKDKRKRITDKISDLKSSTTYLLEDILKSKYGKYLNIDAKEEVENVVIDKVKNSKNIISNKMMNRLFTVTEKEKNIIKGLVDIKKFSLGDCSFNVDYTLIEDILSFKDKINTEEVLFALAMLNSSLSNEFSCMEESLENLAVLRKSKDQQ
ncbi:MAG: hypothetical protein RSB41_02670 [Bacilli bacterium]